MTHVGRFLGVAPVVVAFAATAGWSHAQQAPVTAEAPCTPTDVRGAAPDADLYCIELFHAPDFPTPTGRAELGRVESLFGTRVSADGHHQFAVTLDLTGLPEPAAIGPYSTYVAWVTTPQLRPIVNLGEVTNGRRTVGRVGFDKFLILVTAEATPDTERWTGRIVLRGISASMRMEPEDLLQLTGIMANRRPISAPASGGPAPEPHPAVEMMPGVGDLRPGTRPYLPENPPDGPPPEARPGDVVTLPDGGTLDLEAGLVTRSLNGRTFTMFGFNGQYPGPLIRVPQDATITVNFTNKIDLPTAIHWHGIRLENRYDGVPGVTQDPVAPGATFEYRIHFPDAGIYWYHPHHREDIQQDLGLYGNLRVDARDPAYYGPANREEVLILDDLLVADGGLVPFGRETATHAMMGRFGNLLLVNGEPDYRLSVNQGEVVRFFLTNVSNTRTFNLSFGDAAVKLVASDVGKFERESWAESVVIAPAERYVVDVLFTQTGEVPLTNAVHGIDHVYGNYFPDATTLGRVTVGPSPAEPSHAESFERLREHDDVITDIDRYRDDFDRPVDHRLLFTLEIGALPYPLETLLNLDASFFNPVEWSGTMPRMNWVTTADQVHWIVRDLDTGLENTDIDWAFRMGDRVKIRLRNDRTAIHAMQHPIHLHGQRFLVLSQDGVANGNLVWKDTLLLPVGSTADILLEVSNPGLWMLHCHIAEHLESGMKMVFDVSP